MGAVFTVTHTHTHKHSHTNLLIVLLKLQQSKEEKKAPIYLNHLSVKNEGSTPPFFSFTAPSPLHSPLTPDRPIVGKDKGQEREGER